MSQPPPPPPPPPPHPHVPPPPAPPLAHNQQHWQHQGMPYGGSYAHPQAPQMPGPFPGGPGVAPMPMATPRPPASVPAPPLPPASAAPAAPSPAAPPAWTEHRAPDGRPYWACPATGRRSWSRPAGLGAGLSALDARVEALAEARTRWRQHGRPSDGRLYYSHLDSRATSWSVPAELAEAREAARAEVEMEEVAARAKGASAAAMAAAAAAAAAAGGAVAAPAAAAPPAVVASGASPATAAAAVAAAIATKEAEPAKDAAAASAAAAAAAPPPLPGAAEAAKRLARRRAEGRDHMYDTKAEAVEAFFALLSAAGCTGSTRWEQASAPSSTARRDPRWGALRSDGERKAAFADWAARRKRREREALGAARDAEVEAAAAALGARWRAQQKERRERKEAEEETEAGKAAAALPPAPPPAPSSSSSSPRLLPHPNRATVASVSASFKGLPAVGGASSSSSAAASAWNSLSDDEARQLALEQWRAGAAAEAAREAARARAEQKEKLLRLYGREDSRIEHGTKWEEARAALEQRAKSSAARARRAAPGQHPSSSASPSSFAPAEEAAAESEEAELLLLFASAPASVALEAFEEHVRNLRARWKEQAREAEEGRLLAERKNRDAFRDLLSRRFSSSSSCSSSEASATTSTAAAAAAAAAPPPPPLAPRCRWREARRSFASEPALLAVLANLEGSTPRELFEVALAESEAGFEAARAALLAAAAARGLPAAAAAGEGEQGRSLFDAAVDEAGGAVASSAPAVRALVWSELVSGGRDAFWAARRRGRQSGGREHRGAGEGGERVDRGQQQQGRQGGGKKRREEKRGGRRDGEEDDVVDRGNGDGGEGDDAAKRRRTRRRSADEEEEEGQL